MTQDHQIPAHFNFARDVVDRWAQDPLKLAMWWVNDDGQEKLYTFAKISGKSCQAANVLTSLGVKRGDVVIVILPRIVEWWLINLACMRIGAVVSPATMQLTPKDINYRIRAAEAACIVTTSANGGRVEDGATGCPTLRNKLIIDGERDGWASYGDLIEDASEEFTTADTAGDENSILYFTSGTTGLPKMTVHTHASYGVGHGTTGRLWLELRPEDLHWNLSDTGWAKMGWSSLYAPWNIGAALFVHNSSGAFDPKRTLDILSLYPITTFCGAPTAYRMLVLEDLSRYKFTYLRHCVAAGEPLNPEVIQKWKTATGVTIRDGYGQTETVLAVGSFPSIEPRFGSMGKPSPDFDIHIIDESGNRLPPGQEGDIAICIKPHRPIGLFKEYWKDPERTASVFRGDWYVTGDRGYVDADGYFWFVGRADDVILSGGYRIGPFEVESALLEHPSVAESAVVSSPDEVRGEVVKAFIVLKAGYLPSEKLMKEIQDHTKKVTAPYKYPRKIEFVSSLPKTVSGKIRRMELRQKEWENSGNSGTDT
jgi:acetyl-CoA synthetase/medium-chain acyl-CoA synthetase